MITLFLWLFAAWCVWYWVSPRPRNPYAGTIRTEYYNLETAARHDPPEDFHAALRQRCLEAGIPEGDYDDALREYLEEDLRLEAVVRNHLERK